jgi:hypothetical protein
MKWDFTYCVAIFGVPMTDILDENHQDEKKKRRIDNSVMDRFNIQRQKFMRTTGSARFHFCTSGTL